MNKERDNYNIEALLNYLLHEEHEKYLLFFLTIKCGFGTDKIASLKSDDIKFTRNKIFIRIGLKKFYSAKISFEIYSSFQKLMESSSFNAQNLLFSTKRGKRLPRSYFKYIFETLAPKFDLFDTTIKDLKKTPLKIAARINKDEFEKINSSLPLKKSEKIKSVNEGGACDTYIEEKLRGDKIKIIQILHSYVKHPKIVDIFRIGEDSILFKVPSGINLMNYEILNKMEAEQIIEQLAEISFFFNKKGLTLSIFQNKIYVRKERGKIELCVIPHFFPFYIDVDPYAKIDRSVFPIDYFVNGEIDIAFNLFSIYKVLEKCKYIDKSYSTLADNNKLNRIRGARKYSDESLKYQRIYRDRSLQHIYDEIFINNHADRGEILFFINRESFEIEDLREYLLYKNTILIDIGYSPVLLQWVNNLLWLANISSIKEIPQICQDLST